MKRKLLSAGLAVIMGAGAGYASLVLAQQKPEVLIKQRQAAMTLQGKYFGPLNAMATGKAPFNKDAAARDAGYLEVLSNMAWDGFDPGTKGITENTRALPAIYENQPKFKDYQDRFKTAATKLTAAAKAGDEGAFKAAAGEVGQACGGCHKEFRAK